MIKLRAILRQVRADLQRGLSKLNFLPGGSNPVPVYITRRNTEGQTAEYSQSAGVTIIVQVLVNLNLILWGAYGIIQAVGHLL